MPNLSGQLSVLETRGLVQPATSVLQRELEYFFRHALIQEAAYNSLLRADRRQLHQQVAGILEAGDLGDRDEIAPVLAHHFALAGDRDQARAYYERAGVHALTRYSNQEAAAHYRAALDLAPPPADEARLLAGLTQALVNGSHYTDGIATGRAAVAAYQALGDGDGLARAYAALAGATFGAGNPPGARAVCAEAAAALVGYPESPGRAVLLNETARANLFTGQTAAARDTARQAQALAAQYDDYPTQIAALITLGAAQSRTPAAARDTLLHAVALAAAADLPALGRLAHHHLGVRFIELGEIATAQAHFRQAAALSRLTGFATLEVFAGVLAAYCALWRGDLATAKADLEALRAIAAQIDSPVTGVRFLRLAETALLRYQGDSAAAIDRLEAVIAQERSGGDLLFQIASAWELSAMLLDAGAWERAGAVLEAILPACDRDLMFGRAWPRYRLSRVAAALGDLDRARQWWAEAETRAGPAPLPPDQAEAARAAGHLAAEATPSLR
jgi:ATP/maltotriose-dependent transcriptional regulator MalT